MIQKNILAISGSTRKLSSNTHLLNAIALLTKEIFNVSVFEGLAALPHFNPDDNNEWVLAPVNHFRQQINSADGVIICTPEYAHGVPGTLKNALDWIVTTNELYHKPTVLITASTDGRYGHQSLLETLKVLEAKNVESLQMVVPFIRAKVSAENKITDEKTLTDVLALLERFYQTLQDSATIK